MASQWIRHKLLGKGTYGCVFKAQSAPALACSKSTLMVPFVALKSAYVCRSATIRFEETIFQELGCCEQIVECFGSDISVENGNDYYNLILEYAPGGTLQQLIQYKGGKISEAEAACFTHEMLLKGLDHVHKKGFVHCDMKPDNVLVFPPKNRHDLVQFRLKISDFGAARRIGEKCSEFLDQYGNKNRGTMYYSSPESVVFGEHEAATDIWSLGCIVMQMFGQKIDLWNGIIHPRDLGKLIADFDDRNLMLDHLSINAQDFIRRCLIKDVEERWTAEELLNHPFIVENMEMVKNIEAHNRRTARLMQYRMNQHGLHPLAKLKFPLVFVR